MDAKRFYPLAFLLLGCTFMYGFSVPSGNELLYLLRLARQWDPGFLLNDWTFAMGEPEHFVFNSVFGLPCLILPLEAVGIAGRVLSWLFVSIGILRLARHMGIGVWPAVFAILVWLAIGQSLVAQEWILGGFEAKCVAYALLFFSLDGFLSAKPHRAALMLGLTFSFHPAVGLWAALAAVPAVLTQRLPWLTLVRCGALATLGALPGMLPLLSTVFGAAGGDPGLWKFMVRLKMPFHLDPLSWRKWDILTLYLAFAFNAVHAFRNRGNRVSLFLIAFESALGVFFSAGLIWRLTDNFDLLKFMPFRLFAVLTPLFFLFRLVHSFRQPVWETRPGKAAIAFGLITLMAFPNPVSGLSSRVDEKSWWTRDDGLRPALAWLSQHTENGSIAILPPWRHEGWYYGRRAQIVCYPFHPYDRLEEWRERVESLAGPITLVSDEAKYAAMEAHYLALTDSTVRAVAGRYGARYLVSKSEYGFPRVFTGAYHVYEVVGVPKPR
jgi:hypothetical protein